MKFNHKIIEIISAAVFISLFYYKDLYFATAGLVICAIIHMLVMLVLKTHDKLTWGINILIVISGTATITMQNPMFIKMKPTLVFFILANLIFWSALARKPLLKSILNNLLKADLPYKTWVYSSIYFAAFFLLCAICNEIVWRNFEDEVWIKFKVIIFPIVTSIFSLIAVGLLLRKRKMLGVSK